MVRPFYRGDGDHQNAATGQPACAKIHRHLLPSVLSVSCNTDTSHNAGHDMMHRHTLDEVIDILADTSTQLRGNGPIIRRAVEFLRQFRTFRETSLSVSNHQREAFAYFLECLEVERKVFTQYFSSPQQSTEAKRLRCALQEIIAETDCIQRWLEASLNAAAHS